jgi:hypothetical protein
MATDEVKKTIKIPHEYQRLQGTQIYCLPKSSQDNSLSQKNKVSK